VACTYQLELQTSDVRKAGTAGSVFLTIIGDACAIGEAPRAGAQNLAGWLVGWGGGREAQRPPAWISSNFSLNFLAAGPYQLSNTEAEHFQRGQLDVFEIEGAPDCGQLRQIEVCACSENWLLQGQGLAGDWQSSGLTGRGLGCGWWACLLPSLLLPATPLRPPSITLPALPRCLQVRHEGSGRGAGWHLAWAKVSNRTTGAVAMFKCNRWVDRRGRDDPRIVSVVLALPPDQAATAGGRLSAEDRLLLGGSVKAAAATAAAQAPLVQDVRMEAEPGGEAAEAGEVAAAPPAGLPGYRVVFHTSRICGSGTKAKVGAPVWRVSALQFALATWQAGCAVYLLCPQQVYAPHFSDNSPELSVELNTPTQASSALLLAPPAGAL
jgi:hypothetical protein